MAVTSETITCQMPHPTAKYSPACCIRLASAEAFKELDTGMLLGSIEAVLLALAYLTPTNLLVFICLYKIMMNYEL